MNVLFAEISYRILLYVRGAGNVVLGWTATSWYNCALDTGVQVFNRSLIVSVTDISFY